MFDREYVLVKLGDLIDTRKGYAFKSKWYSRIGHPIVKVSDFTSDSIDASQLECVPFNIASKYARYELNEGDVVVQTVGSWPSNPASVVGKAIRVPKEAAGALLNQNAVKLTPDDSLDRRYLFYLLRSQTFADYIVGTAQGAASQASITLDSLRNFSFPRPPLPTQRRIAGILSAYDELIENNTRRIRLLEEMARALYREWLVHYRFPGHEEVAMVEHDELGAVPEGWEVQTLDDVLSYNIGGGWGKEEQEDQFTERVAVIRGTDMPSARLNDFEGCPIRYIKSSQLKSRRLEEGDILMEVSGGSKDQPVGRTLYVSDTLLRSVNEEPICASFCKLLRADEDVLHPRLLSAHFEEMYDDRRIEQYQVQSTGLKNLKFAHLLEHELVVPPGELQRRYVELTRPSLDLAQLLGVKNRNLRQARDLLLPRLVSGALPVEAAEEELEAVA